MKTAAERIREEKADHRKWVQNLNDRTLLGLREHLRADAPEEIWYVVRWWNFREEAILAEIEKREL